VTLTNATVSPTNGCVGTTFTASVSQFITNGQLIVTTHYTNACGTVDTNNCPDSYTTNKPAPTILSTWWTVSGAGCSPSSGIGTTASFTANSPGTNNTVTFYTTWQHVCDTNTSTISASTTFTVECPTETITASTPLCGVSYGAWFTYCFNCANGWYARELLTDGTNTCDPGAPIGPNTNTFKIASGCISDEITDPNGPPADVADCSDTTYQVLQIGPTADIRARALPLRGLPVTQEQSDPYTSLG
jgi:hypothetical protein